MTTTMATATATGMTTASLIELLRHKEGHAYLNWLRQLGRQLQLAIDAAAGHVSVDALDAFDGTPLVDIKPWLPGVDVPPGWHPGQANPA